jgi:thiamine pyrophosphokinase
MFDIEKSEALIVLNGNQKKVSKFIKAGKYKYIVAADGALDSLLAKGIIPNAVVGDFDSVSDDSLVIAKSVRVKIDRIECQDTNDFEKCLMHMEKEGHTRIDVIAYSGFRVDHILATLDSAARNSDRFTFRFVDNTADGFILGAGKSVDILEEEGQTCSVLPLKDAKGVTLEGFHWPLENSIMGGDYPPASSNRITSDKAKVSVESGVLFIYCHQ